MRTILKDGGTGRVMSTSLLIIDNDITGSTRDIWRCFYGPKFAGDSPESRSWGRGGNLLSGITVALSFKAARWYLGI